MNREMMVDLEHLIVRSDCIETLVTQISKCCEKKITGFVDKHTTGPIQDN